MNNLRRLRKHFKAHKFLLLALFLASLLWLAFRPNFYANVDEHNYLWNAFQISQHGSLVRQYEWEIPGGFENSSGFYVSKYNLGASLPFSLVAGQGIDAVLALNWLFWLLIIVTSYFWLIRLGLPKYSILIVGFSPALNYFGRTAFSEIFAALLVLSLSLLVDSATSQLSKYDKLRSANGLWRLSFTLITIVIFSSLLVITRYNMALVVGAFYAFLGVKFFAALRKKRVHFSALAKQLIVPVLLQSVFTGILLYINNNLYGSPLASGYRLSGEEAIILGEMIRRLPSYFLLLNILPPGLLLISILAKNTVVRLSLLVAWVNLLFYSVAGGYLVQNEPTDLVVAVRFFIPFFPILIIAWIAGWKEISKGDSKRLQVILNTFLGLALAVSLFLSVFLHWQHNQFLQSRSSVAREVINFAENGDLFLGTEDDFIYVSPILSPDKQLYYLPLKSLTEGELELPFSPGDFNRILLMEISYPNRDGYPSEASLRTLKELAEEGKIELVLNKNQINLYEYKY